MSGEHGDGRSRSELLQYMYTPEVIELLAAVKYLFDRQSDERCFDAARALVGAWWPPDRAEFNRHLRRIP